MSKALSLPKPAGKMGPIFHLLWTEWALSKRQLPARMPPPSRVSLFSVLPQLKKNPLLLLHPFSSGSASVAKPQPFATLRAHQAPGPPRHRCDPPAAGPPLPPATPRRPRSLRLILLWLRRSNPPPPGPRRGGARRPGPCPGGRGHWAGRRARPPGLRAPARPQPEGNAANSRGFQPVPCLPLAFRTLGFSLPASRRPLCPVAPASSPLCIHHILSHARWFLRGRSSESG